MRYGTANIDRRVYEVLQRMKKNRRRFYITEYVEEAILEKMERDGIDTEVIFEDDE